MILDIIVTFHLKVASLRNSTRICHEHPRIVLSCVNSICIKMTNKRYVRTKAARLDIGKIKRRFRVFGIPRENSIGHAYVRMQVPVIGKCYGQLASTIKQSLHTKARARWFNCRRYFTRTSTIRDLFPRYGEEQRRLTSLGTSIKLRLANNREIRVGRCKRGEATPPPVGNFISTTYQEQIRKHFPMLPRVT